MTSLLHWAAAALGHQERWVAVTVGTMLAMAASGLWWLVLHAEQVALTADRPLAVLAASTYTALALAVLLLRGINRPLGYVIVTCLLALMLAEGTSYPEPSLRWVCLAFLTVLPLLAVVLLGLRGVLAVTAAAVAITVVIAFGLPDTPQVRIYVATTMTTLVLVPILVVGVLLDQLRRTQAMARLAARTDPLTGLLNRRGLLEDLPALLDAAITAGQHLTVTLIDLDHFKRINDDYGHAAGDDVLVRTAATLAAAVRSGDLLVRHGGEELVWLARHHRAHEAVMAAQRARASVATQHQEDGLPAVTASFGVSSTARLDLHGAKPTAGAVLDHLLARADAALYRAKQQGRNRVEIAEGASSATKAGDCGAVTAGTRGGRAVETLGASLNRLRTSSVAGGVPQQLPSPGFSAGGVYGPSR